MKLTRRRALTAAAAAIAAAGAGIGEAGATTSGTATTEQAELERLYRLAKADGRLTVYMGGDKPGQWDWVGQAFTTRFPELKCSVVTDLSKVHDARIDNQLANRDLVVDVAILQTAQDFTRWKNIGALLRYRPIGHDQIFANAKDADGYWTGIFYGAFAEMVNTKELPADPSSFTALDLLDARFKNKLIFTYPNDDDAVLYDFKLTVDKYGWDWLKRIMAQNPKFLRGTPGSAAGVASGEYLATLGTTGDPTPDATVVLPATDPFNSWAQHGAIFKDGPHRAAAQLFLSWITSQSFQTASIADWTWSVRKDVDPSAGRRPLADYPNTNPDDFVRFMSDRDQVERFRAQVQLYVGDVQGPDPADPTDSLGLTPGRF